MLRFWFAVGAGFFASCVLLEVQVRRYGAISALSRQTESGVGLTS